MRARHCLTAAWAAGVVALTAPWSSFQPHSHWNRVTWIPFTGIVRPADVLLNGLLYLPLGLLHARSNPRRLPRVAGLTLAAFLLSTLMELSQVFSHGRHPTATDVAANVAGAILGLLIGEGKGVRRD